MISLISYGYEFMYTTVCGLHELLYTLCYACMVEADTLETNSSIL